MPLGKDSIVNAMKDAKENPFNTTTGQEIVSIGENFWARLAREGRFRAKDYQNISMTQGVLLFVQPQFKPNKGCVLYPVDIVLTSEADTLFIFAVNTGVADADLIYRIAYVKAFTAFEWKFDGSVFIKEGGFLEIRALCNTTGGKLWGSVYGIEVTEND